MQMRQFVARQYAVMIGIERVEAQARRIDIFTR